MISSDTHLEEQVFEVMLDCVSYKSKAQAGKDAAAIRSRLGSSESRKTLTTSELIRAIKQGYSVMPGVCAGGTKRGNWISQQVFMLDFDEKASGEAFTLDDLDALLNSAYDRELFPSFLYFSLSATEEAPRWRFVYILDEPATTLEEAEAVFAVMRQEFPEADKSCFDPVKMFFGGGETWDFRSEI